MASTIIGVAIATVDQSTPIASVPTPSSWIASPSTLASMAFTPVHYTSPTLESAQSDSTPQSESLSSQSPLTLNGIGPVRVGMTLAEAEQAARVPIPAADTDDNGCGYTQPQGIENLLLMVTDNQIARVDVVRDSTIRTLNGAGIGNTRAEIEAMYPGQIEVSPHEYVQGGHYLTYVPTDVSDRNYRIVFETDENDIVTRLRSGKLPEVTWVETCF
ncbi:hypothetical protein H6F88_18590 [Oculatella sp. FACHB-28]|uniref:hypothetical protein n=1 Tax=Oculatella sp. FACHB-28 TaxID=2692845 RepID=UPI001688AFD6|nr:hypothetical protein [Oculatella sp. FACHB-28]MBD2058000.1 hypothetical protein [Oculatella sp. FACHB-28]MBD2069546.1 hypothetical protein [Leptolyngbya sp. FACHB-671]